jgi:superfamily II DNA helicase RecQ
MRHLMITFGRHSKDSNVKIQALSPEEVEEAFQDVYNDAVERQANHTPNTGVALYASETAAIFRSRNNMAQSHFKVSTDWHRNLGFKSLPDHQSERKDLACSQPQVTHNVNLKILLVETFGRSAKFRGKQRMVLESIMDGEPAVAYIAGTGSGKSLAFLLPACYDGYGQTIVVAPLVAVRIDLHQRCEQLSLITSVFGAQDFNETARVIFAMPEHLASSRFQALVHRLRDMGRLERIVLDEFHYVLMDDHEYRPQLLAIRELAQFATPITLLSATVPPVSQAEAFRLLGLSSTVRVFREPTVRKNIRYQVDSTYAKKHFGIDDMAAYVRTQQEIHQKILVYVAHANSAEELARKLGAMCYHGQLSEQARTGVQANFTTAIQAVLVATIAFNAGVDVPDIGRVVRFGEPDHPLTYLQESGRGGRDGRVCIATIVLGRGIPTYLHKQLPTVRSVIEDIVQRGTLQSGCLRVPIDRYIDGDNTRTCCRGDEEPCGFCASLQDTVTSASSHKGTYTSSVMDTPQQSNATCSEPFTPATNLQVGVDDLSLDKLPSVPSVSEQRLMSMRNTDPNSILTPRLGFEATPSPHTPRRESWSQAAQHKRMRSQSMCLLQTQVIISSASLSYLGSTLSHDMSSPMRQAEHESIKKAKIRRTLLFNQEHALNRRKQTSRILEELKQTATWWTENCVKCYADEEEFDHPKTECPKFTKDVVKHFRQHKLKGKLPKGQCYWCSLPMSLCAKWIDATSGVTKDRPDKTVECTFPHAILDAWACLWEYSPTIRENWKKRIVEETSGEIHGETDEEFAAYFTGTIPMPGEKPLGRIAYDVNWITQGYIRQLKDT